jgi:hypothetical protein
MADSKYIKLITLLHDKTLNNKLTWEATTDENSFITSFSDYTVKIEGYSTEQGSYYTLTVLDSLANVIDEVYDYNFDNSDFNQDPEAYMRELYQSARRQASGIDEALDSILRQLN